VTAPSPLAAPIPAGTPVVLHSSARFYGRELVAGGAPWGLLRLPGASRTVVDRWRHGDVVRPGEELFARTLVQRGLLEVHYSPVEEIDDVDVVIPVRDGLEGLARLLMELDGLPVTIVDDGSLEPERVTTLAAARGARVVRHDVSGGPGASRNSGMRATARPFVLFVDADVVLGGVDDAIAALRATLRDPTVGAVAPRVRGPAGDPARDHFEHLFGALDLGPRSGLVHSGGPVPYVPSACLMVRREASGEGFDPTLRVGEDVDFVWHLLDEGWLVRYLADVTVFHAARPSWPAWWHQRVGYGRSSGELARRHGTRMSPLRADRWTLAAWAGVVARAPWLSARAIAVVRASLERRLEGSTENSGEVAGALVTRSILLSGGPLARALVRTYGPLLLVAALHPRLRRRALAVWAIGTAYRFRTALPRPSDVGLGVADDLAYALGVASGAWRARSLASLTPAVTASTISWREVLGARPSA
jgi:mycofactocin system glycosyltransferase